MARRGQLTARHREAAALLVEGLPPVDVAERVKVRRQTVYTWQSLPAFQAEMQRARAAYTARAESELAAARPSAVRALRAIVELGEKGDGDVSTSDVTKAALGLLSASAPPTEAQRQRAMAELLRRLPRELREQVIDTLQGADRETLAALSDSELARLAEGDA